MTTNQHGLSRNIPSEVKFAVRQRCGFGCARCATTIYEYEHFFPDFKDAIEHDPNQIVLLCPNCHGLVTKNVIPKDQVRDFSENPKAKQLGYSSQNLPVFNGMPSIKYGGGLIEDTRIALQFRDDPVIWFDSPETGSKIARVNFRVTDAAGDNFLRVDENEWKVLRGSWDFEWKGARYIFKTASGLKMFILRMEPPHLIHIELFRTSLNGTPLEINEHCIRYGNSEISGFYFKRVMGGILFS